ncbi:MAG: pyrroline-5-carboxylate reductase [Crocinitomicaceae bacterium]|nr:pyrroline-5-carboxylate reductase [Crocinitomicaceae bacterium]MBK8925049.1 pyrroline-5-carboxylate reductase [Crocinitomicaceae bacterium]
MKSIAILGCGNIGLSIAEGLLSANTSLSNKLTLTRRNIQSLKFFEERGVEVTKDNLIAVRKSQIIILAVKPYMVENLLKEIAPELKKDHILVSVASEVSLDQISSLINKTNPVFRVMPNTASAIRESITCICTKNGTVSETEEIANLFKGIGETAVIDENLMEAATILGACGIAYVLRFIRAMIQGGIQIGFDAKTATLITTQTVKGAAELLLKNNSHPEQEIDKVTTPKGCTITGLNEMEHQGFSSALIHGIVKSFQKIEKN